MPALYPGRGPAYNAATSRKRAGAVNVQGRFFALYRERVGSAVIGFELDDGSTVGDLVDAVMRRNPDFSPDPSKIVVAVNREYVNHSEPLHDGDEAAFIPPVSGGA